MKQIRRSLLLTIPLATLASFTWVTTAIAQSKITPDKSLGAESSVVTTPNVMINGHPIEQISGGATRGANLFHSFQEFNVDTGRGAYFTNPSGIQNILVRVTGGNSSSILGTLGVLGNANLFFLNPSGISFGPNARLDVNGSFFASTANSLVFDNGFEFSATNPQAPPLLTINIPIGLRFRDNPGGISVQGMGAMRDPNTQAFQNTQGLPLNSEVGLSVPSGNTLALVGGKVNLDGGILTASGGRVELGAIAGAGTVGLNLVDNQWRLSIPDSVPRADISLANQAAIDVTGNGRGSVAISAHNLDILEGSNISAGIALDPAPYSSPPGDITLNTTGLLTINYPSRVTNNVTVTNGMDKDTRTGDAGDINIIAGDININNRANDDHQGDVLAALEARSGGRGSAGNISLSARGSINLIGQDVGDNDEVISTQFVTSTRSGGGNITLNANGSISLTNAYLTSASGNNSGSISLFGKKSVSITEDSSLIAGSIQGNSGNIKVQSNGHVSIDRSSLSIDVGGVPYTTSTPGNAGEININGQSISITNGSFVGASTKNKGINAGNIRLTATDKIEISGYDPSYNPEGNSGNRNRPFVYTTVQTSGLPGSLGLPGEITIHTPTLRVSDGASLRADSQSSAQSGNIKINANVVELINGGQLFTSASGTGDAGNIELQNTQRLVIDGTNPTFDQFTQKAQAFVRKDSDDENTNYLLGPIRPESGIFANTTSSQGGSITINGLKLLLLRHNAQISADGGNNKGSGGNITINAPNGFIVAKPSENSDILANAIGGPGGKITINATGIYGLKNRTGLSPDPTISEINASSEFGANGIVLINTPEVDPSRGLVKLPVNVVDPTTLIAQTPCHRSIGSEFTIIGRGGLPSNPNQILASDNVRVDLVKPVSSASNSPTTSVKLPSTTPTVKRLVPAQGWIFNDKGQVLLTAYDPTNTGSQRSWQEPASCAKR